VRISCGWGWENESSDCQPALASLGMLKLLKAVLKLFAAFGGQPQRKAMAGKPAMRLSISRQVTEETAEDRAANEDAARRQRIADSRKPRPQMPMEMSMVRVTKDDLWHIVKTFPFEAQLQVHYKSAEVQCYRLRLETGQPAYLLFSPSEEWIDVLTTGKLKSYDEVEPSRFKRYGFSRDLSRWSYGEGPTGAKALRAALRCLDPTIQSRERF